MIGELGVLSWGSVPIFESGLVLEATEKPVREHKPKQWMAGRAYHARIQKKWIKRFGYVMQPCIWQTPMGFIAHPTMMASIREALAQQERRP